MATGAEMGREGIAILALTAGAQALGARLAAELPARRIPCKGRIREAFAESWQSARAIICIMATGIVVRELAPLIARGADKYQDPAVVVLDERGQFVISLLSGHIGGANGLALRVAAITRGQAVLTTSSDVQGLTALDLWCRDAHLKAESRAALTSLMGKLTDQGFLTIWADAITREANALPALPPDLRPVASGMEADIIVACHAGTNADSGARLYPALLCVGIGCNRGTGEAELAETVRAVLLRHHLSPLAVARLASIDLKADEAGLLALAHSTQWPLSFFSREELNAVPARPSSSAVFRTTGAHAVAEPAALLAAGPGARLIIAKEKTKNVTVTVAVPQNITNIQHKEHT